MMTRPNVQTAVPGAAPLIPLPYLAAEAATRADLELPLHVEQELAHAVHLFDRADRAITRELAALRAAGIDLDPMTVLRVSTALSALSGALRMRELLSKEARA
jgi:hypothetical protein